jgi:hypothetical protein
MTQINITVSSNMQHQKRIQELNQQAKTHGSNHQPTQSFFNPKTKTIIQINGEENVESLETHLIHSKYQQSVQELLQQKYNWNNITFNNIDWDLHKDVHQYCTQYKQLTIKLIH